LPVNILKTSIISPLGRLYFNVGNFNRTSLCLYVKTHDSIKAIRLHVQVQLTAFPQFCHHFSVGFATSFLRLISGLVLSEVNRLTDTIFKNKVDDKQSLSAIARCYAIYRHVQCAKSFGKKKLLQNVFFQ